MKGQIKTPLKNPLVLMAKCWQKNGSSSILNNWFVFDIIKRYQYQDGITSHDKVFIRFQ
jgi:hypothetical protein